MTCILTICSFGCEWQKRKSNEIIPFETEDRSITLPAQVNADTVWLNRNQLAELFGRDIKTIGKHIGNALKEELEPSTVAKFATTTRHGAIAGKTQTHLTEYYNLDMINSVGYRVKSQRGVEFPTMGKQSIETIYSRGICGKSETSQRSRQCRKTIEENRKLIGCRASTDRCGKYSTALNLLDS